MLSYKPNMSPSEVLDFERELREEFKEYDNETNRDLVSRINGLNATRGSSGKQFVGYLTLEQFYRGDQWDHDEPKGASQRTDNYCSVIVDNFASLLFDAPVEINCKSQDETDDLLEMKAEFKEKLLQKVYDDNDADLLVFPEMSKNGSLFGDTFIIGPILDKNGSENRDDWKIRFFNANNPANIKPIFMDENYQELYGFIETTPISPVKCAREYAKALKARGLTVEDIIKKYGGYNKGNKQAMVMGGQKIYQKMINRSRYWTDQIMAVFLEGELIDWYWHDWKFVPLQYVKNIFVPNYPYGKSDIEDAIDPQLAYNTTKNDLSNLLKFLSTVNLQGHNLDDMEVVVYGMSKIFNLPEDAELQPLQRGGDPYSTSNYMVDSRRAILDITGTSEALMSSIQQGVASGRSMAMALQSVVRKMNPRIKYYTRALRTLNSNILKLLELYFPETKPIIMGDYSNEVSIISTLLRNIIDEINKFQAGLQSMTTTQKNLGIPQPKIEQKRIKNDLSDPVLGPQVARQPALLASANAPQLQNPESSMPPTEGSNGATGLQNAPNQTGTSASPAGSITANNQRAAGGAVAIPPQVNP